MSMHEQIKDNNFVIIGDEDVILGFRSLGFKVYILQEEDKAGMILDELVNTKAGICLVQDKFYELEKEKINSYKKLPLPIFIPFSKDAKMDLLDNITRDIKIRATGAL